jgi:hypothetical protein
VAGYPFVRDGQTLAAVHGRRMAIGAIAALKCRRTVATPSRH